MPSNNFGSAAFRYISVTDVNRDSGDVSAAQRTSWVAATAPPQSTGDGDRRTPECLIVRICAQQLSGLMTFVAGGPAAERAEGSGPAPVVDALSYEAYWFGPGESIVAVKDGLLISVKVANIKGSWTDQDRVDDIELASLVVPRVG